MSDSEDDDELPPEKVKKTLLPLCDRQSSRSKIDYKGVKSYLHQFYEYATGADGHSSEGQCYIKSRRIRVKSIWWRLAFASGLFLMILGGMAVLVSYVVPRRSVLVEEDEDIAVIDKDAIYFNHNLDLLKLAGLATFCIGGIGSSLALLVASCCWKCCTHVETKYDDIEPLKIAEKLVEEDDNAGDHPPLSPTESKVPGIGSVVSVQPAAGTLSGGNGESVYPIPNINTLPFAD